MTRSHQNPKHTLTAIEQFHLLPEGTLAEVINDVLYVSPSPTLYHQKVTMTLLGALYNHVMQNDLGEVYPGPTDVYVNGGKDIVIPDINFISNDNNLVMDAKGIIGAPDLLIEVYSPSTGKRDRTIKKALYERIGVREYWIVYPSNKNAEGYLLENGKYGDALQLNSQIDVRILNRSFSF